MTCDRAANDPTGNEVSVITSTSTRPWWQRKRLIPFALFWLALIYPFSMGPIHYACHRQWLPWDAYRIYKPLKAALGERGMHATYLWHWDMFWKDLGWEHYRAEMKRRIESQSVGIN